jgi:hypothetical protein
MPPSYRPDVPAALDHLGNQAHSPGPCRRGPGRPSQGIRSGYVRIELYVPPNVREDLDRLAGLRELQTGRSTPRADIIREALTTYLREHLPASGSHNGVQK